MSEQSIISIARTILIVPGRHGKYIFTQESFYLQGILNDINEQDTSFLNCKHKHMMKRGAPPDKFGVLYRLLPIEFHEFTSRIILWVITLWCLVLSQFFRDGMGPFKTKYDFGVYCDFCYDYNDLLYIILHIYSDSL